MLSALGLTGWADLLLFMSAVFVLNATPGVDMLLTITRTLQGGAKAGVAAALGINAGCLVHTLAAAFGLAALLAVSATAFAAIRWLGAAYLLWLAVGLWRDAWRTYRGAPDADGAASHRSVGASPRTAWQDFRIGFITNVLNPKVALFFLAFIPQFIAPGTADKMLAFIGLGLLFIAQSTPFLLLVVWLALRLQGLGASRHAMTLLQASAGGLFALLALRLLTARQVPA